MSEVICPYCGHEAKLIDSKQVYGKSYGNMYMCWDCDAYVGTHKGTTKPLGRLANKDLRHWKVQAHAAFDPLWKSKRMSRSDAYDLLSNKLGMKRSECHIGMFDVDTCKRVIAVLNND